MKAQTILALSLILCLALGLTARPAHAQEISETEKITAEEEQQAREIAERFIRRMQETNDLTPLIGEMFVPDYALRLRQEALNEPLPLLSRSAVEQASREELARYQLALNNGLYQASLLFMAYRASHPAEEDEDEEGTADYKQIFPPDILELCKADPILKMLFEENTPESADDGGTGASPSEQANVEDVVEPIRNREQLRRFTSTLEQAVALARRHVAALPLKLSLPERHKGATEEANWTAEREAMKPRAWTLNEEFYGYPKGTRVICVNAVFYHLDLIPVDGKLKVLALNFDMD